MCPGQAWARRGPGVGAVCARCVPGHCLCPRAGCRSGEKAGGRLDLKLPPCDFCPGLWFWGPSVFSGSGAAFSRAVPRGWLGSPSLSSSAGHAGAHLLSVSNGPLAAALNWLELGSFQPPRVQPCPSLPSLRSGPVRWWKHPGCGGLAWRWAPGWKGRPAIAPEAGLPTPRTSLQ